MRSNPETDARLREKLREAVQKLADGSADKFGRLIGYTNGGYIREALLGKKPVRAALITKVHAYPGMGGWFDSTMPPMTALSVRVARSDEDEAVLQAFRDLPTKMRQEWKDKLFAEAEVFRAHKLEVLAELEDKPSKRFGT